MTPKRRKNPSKELVKKHLIAVRWIMELNRKLLFNFVEKHFKIGDIFDFTNGNATFQSTRRP